MDFDGFLLLIDRDIKKFEAWKKNSKNLTLEQSRLDYKEWRNNIIEAKEKYWDLDLDGKEKDISAFMAKMTYFYHLTLFSWHALNNYTEKLQNEYKSLKKSKTKKPKLRRKRKPYS